MKKVCTLFAIFVFSGISQAKTIYALKCPGEQGLISSLRNQWLKEGHVIIPHAAEFSEELSFHQARVGRYNTSNLSIFRNMHPHFSDNVDFRSGIVLQHQSTNIPEIENGCKTVILIRDFREGDNQSQIGDRDAWDLLPAIDKMILQFSHLNEYERQWVPVILSETIQGLSLKEYNQLGILGSWTAISYKGMRLNSCKEWYDEETPKKCLRAYTREAVDLADGVRGVLKSESHASFWENGNLKEAEFKILKHIYRSKEYSCFGVSSFNEDGSVEWCEGFAVDPSGRVRYHVGEKIKDHLRTADLSNVAFDQSGRLMFATIDYNHGLLPQNHKPLDQTPPGAVRLHSNGKFRSGIVERWHNGNVEYEYVECNNKGRVIQRKKFPDNSRVSFLSQLWHRRTGETTEEESIYYRHLLYWRTLHLNVTEVYKSNPKCSIIINESRQKITIPAKCEVVLHVEAVTEDKEF